MLRVPRACLEQTLAHLRAVWPEEGVGLWLGRAGRVLRVQPLANRHPTPRVAYRADPQALLEALRAAERAGLELLAIYHSHPQGPPCPSEADRAQAYWRVPYVIFDLKGGGFRAYRLPEGEEVEVVEE
ncbi:metal-dependent protease of the PAD1/JAB1 superfamily [Meiothermus sp. QL-1]|uniref:Mov34/MPN/PAD-1 family protein n=1 Tax=Meiothermus sp. QL-1 TaxID=2058095 RepID=UPI000E0C632B|nr:M67 family metallopeptidase [Meiothermus sp. QL-1]RDI96626.1 metal-dependent protease of the PAD1/JAB1 superfamily [Meiothermus sp. QL-1]